MMTNSKSIKYLRMRFEEKYLKGKIKKIRKFF
jgi:hypothetical protein